MKIKFDSDDKVPLNKTIETHSLIIAVRVVFHENNKYYPITNYNCYKYYPITIVYINYKNAVL